MELEYKVCGIRPATTPEGARANRAEWERKEAERVALERKAATTTLADEVAALRERFAERRRRLESGAR